MDWSNISRNLKNHTEEIVIEILEDLLEKNDFGNICTCEKCLLDIASYSLNRLPPRYVASHHGEIRTRIKEFETQLKVDAISTITEAIKLVSQNPRH
ncbi:MAG TPA: late competence development ComFB family protein [Halanaerobiaceae bacterium]|nr:late competence development ComFB family protein [Halanaerobiaceae bacterium]